MPYEEALAERLREAGYAVKHVEKADGGVVAAGNIVAARAGAPTLIDPAASCSWPEADISTLWCSTRSPATDRFFTVDQAVAGLPDGWEERMPVLNLRELLSTLAHGDDHRDAAEVVRELIAPFRSRNGGRGRSGGGRGGS
ncbi:hypothetical protein CP967_21925 [Streptomyces nitrosporeus]|uniref:Uncharacterized protein n=1 Tax=Streptomyces nitrosporeus TaxID=28894 RepID=A0A5J6FD21_9ACTN|nr:hypothetical protein [Streptomyces nitrosporeus]QEU74298.1 hypothetical protein CP967_21925 [Streptomyces nitrosporeus]GGY96628.1 hypothetical protein GCM10010327_29000 [Streptomyces nitrosporeus]